MKKFLLCAIVLGSAALAAASTVVTPHPADIVRAPEIQVTIGNLRSGGGQGLAAKDGYLGSGTASAIDSDGTAWHAAESDKVVSNQHGHFLVLAHYDIERNHDLNHFDVAIPVQEAKPNWTAWTQVDSNFKACAYFTGSTIDYHP